ncbi:hypothetical protein PHPALM_15037 [Phytophthora palmivora]|uniref:Tc1-like transposase DDE domain-containing protein n=1 Tax=Phytophthora palmivora TaxID=4796 RepID=A0A2P4XTB1_9STRA|nr:hypothetical protein PHPALM_15037 [Phytophthora palmivora]
MTGLNRKDAAAYNGVKERAARSSIQHTRSTGKYEAPESRRGSARKRKILLEHVDCIVDMISANYHLTLRQMKDLLFDEYNLCVSPTTIRAALDGVCFTLKQVHRDSQYRNTAINKEKRRDFAIKLLQYVAEAKNIFYVDEANFNLWCSRNFGWSKAGTRTVEMNASSKARNIHASACISRDGLAHCEGRFGSYKAPQANVYMRRLTLKPYLQIGYPLERIDIVIDNASCHNRIEEVFDENEFLLARCLSLGFKAPAKRFLSANYAAILAVPPEYTISDHRETFLYRATEEIFPRVASPVFCRKCIHHTYKFVAHAILMKDMKVSE